MQCLKNLILAQLLMWCQIVLSSSEQKEEKSWKKKTITDWRNFSLQNRKGEYCRGYDSQIPWSHSKYLLISWVTWTEIVYPNFCPIPKKFAFIFFFTVNTSLRNCDHISKDREFLSDFYLPTFNVFFLAQTFFASPKHYLKIKGRHPSPVLMIVLCNIFVSIASSLKV